MSLRALLYRRPAEPKAIQIFHDEHVYLVRVRRHRQARRYTLRILAATREVVLTMPPRGCLREAKEFAQKHGGWIAQRLHHLPKAEPFAHGSMVPLRGEPHRIVHRRGLRGTVWVEVADDGERRLCVAGDSPHVDRRVAYSCAAKPGATSNGQAGISPNGLDLPSSRFRSAIRRAAGAPAPRPAFFPIPGG